MNEEYWQRFVKDLNLKIDNLEFERNMKQDEIERLNNIINELENKLLQLRLTDIDGRTIVYRMLDKLKELKDSD